MKEKQTRLTAFGLALLLAAVPLVSCGMQKDDAPGVVTTASSVLPEVTTSPEAVETSYPTPELPAIDGQQRNIVVLHYIPGISTFKSFYNEIYSEATVGEAINDAVWKRNNILAEKYNITISEIQTSNVVSDAHNAIMANTGDYDLLDGMPTSLFNLALKGDLMDLSTLDALDFEAPWWRGTVMANLSVGEKNYLAIGDTNLTASHTIGVTYFNKQMIADRGMQSPYDLVHDGKWTFETLSEYVTQVSEDVDGDGQMTETDRYGLATNNFVWQPMYYAAGNTFVGKTADDVPAWSGETEQNINVLTKIVELIRDKSTVLWGETYKSLVKSGRSEIPRTAFLENRALFWIELMYSVPTIRDMEMDFGLLPMPKSDVNQREYWSYISAGNASALSLPYSVENPDLMASLIEDMTFQSYQLVRPAYFDRLLTGIIARDNESAEMLDIMYEHVSLDMLLVMSSAGNTLDKDIRAMLDGENTGFASLFAKNDTAYAATLDEVIKTLYE